MKRKKPGDIERSVNQAFEHLANLVAIRSVASLLDAGSVATLALAAAALLHAQDREPAASTAETPLETLQHVAPMLGNNARNAVGSIACALANLQTELRRDTKGTLRDMSSMLDKKPKRKR